MSAPGMDVARLRVAVVEGLRRWAQGSLTDQAAVELLARSCGGRLLRPGVAWVRPCRRPGWYWLDADALTAHAATLADGSDKHVLLLAALLVDGDTPTPPPAAATAEGSRMTLLEVLQFAVRCSCRRCGDDGQRRPVPAATGHDASGWP